MFLPTPTVSFKEQSSKIASAILLSCPHGVLYVSDLPKAAPLKEISEAFDVLSSDHDASNPQCIANRLNSAYTKNLVYKDSFADGNGGSSVDAKRVLDISPERLHEIGKAEPELLIHGKEQLLPKAIPFWQQCADEVSPKITEALVEASGSEAIKTDAHFNFRMVDYYHRTTDSMTAPRCGEHRDFGSYTLIFADHPGLEVKVGSQWVKVAPPQKDDTAILLFGWCTQIRSNGRIPAAMHRVVDESVGVRRTAAVLFVAPKDCNTTLEPVVHEGEKRLYISGVKVGQLRGNMARKWKKREGTLKEEEKELEEDEVSTTDMLTQDDVIRRTVCVQ